MNPKMVSALAIDPGPRSSALAYLSVNLEDSLSKNHGIIPMWAEDLENEQLRLFLRGRSRSTWYVNGWPLPNVLVVETMATIYEAGGARDPLITLTWQGRLMEAFSSFVEDAGKDPVVIEVTRSQATSAVGANARGKGAPGKDAQVRRALIDAYGGDAVAFGKRCAACKGKGIVKSAVPGEDVVVRIIAGRAKTVCGVCAGGGFDPPRGPLHGWKGSHVFAALACAFAAFRPGGLYGVSRGPT